MSRADDLERLKAQAIRAHAARREAAGVRPDLCPACGNGWFSAEDGCSSCGHGRRSWLSRHRVPASIALFATLATAGFAALFTLGAAAQGGVALNAALIGTGAFLDAIGMSMIVSPHAFSVGDVGTDAFGMQHMSNLRPATKRQGTVAGALSLVIGALLLVFGVFAGHFI